MSLVVAEAFLCEVATYGAPLGRDKSLTEHNPPIFVAGSVRDPSLLRPIAARDGGNFKDLENELGGKIAVRDGALQKLSKLNTWIKAKQKEFEETATSEEERMDKARALERMKHLGRIAEILAQNYPPLLGRYLREIIQPLQRYDARTLNKILSSETGDSLRNLGALADLSSGSERVGTFLTTVLSRRSEWKSAGQYFYLPGLPIIVVAKSLSPKDRQKLEEASRLIFKSGWRDTVFSSLRGIESIIPIWDRDATYAAKVVSFRQNKAYINMAIEPSPTEIAMSIVHEGQHLEDATESASDFENESAGPSVRHDFVHGEESFPPGSLLMELQAYGVQHQFLMRLLDAPWFKPSPREGGQLIFEAFLALLEAKKGLQLLAELPSGSLNVDERGWLQELTELWGQLEPRIISRWLQVVNTSLASEDHDLRRQGYLYAANALQKDTDPDRVQLYTGLFRDALGKELDLEIIHGVAEADQVPQELRREAKTRLRRFSDFMGGIFGPGEAPDGGRKAGAPSHMAPHESVRDGGERVGIRSRIRDVRLEAEKAHIANEPLRNEPAWVSP